MKRFTILVVMTPLFWWFLVGPLAASVTRGEQHSLRANLWIPFFLITMASGFGYFIQKVKHFKKILVVYNFFVTA